MVPCPQRDGRNEISMKKFKYVGITVVCMLLSALLTFQITHYALRNVYREQLNEAYGDVSRYNKLLEVDSLFRNLYVKELDEDVLMDGILTGYVYGTGDKYAQYYNAESFATYMDSMQGDMQGIGIYVTFNADYNAIEVLNVMPDSPALEAGVEPGDLIIYVGEGETQESVAELGYYVALTKLQGEAGTKAIFTVARGKNYEERKSFSILRGFVTEQTVMHHVCTVDPSVGVVRILSFDAKTPQQFADAVNDLLGKGCSGFIFDVRNNPGGELNSICTILDALLPEGPVIRTIDRDGKEEVVYTSDKNAFDLKMVVLVNENTASAGELFCSALQDYKKAPIVGVQTYGKGSMQTIRQLSDGSGVSVTYRYYCPPYSDNFDGKGVTPDVIVEAEGALLEKNIFKVTDKEDNQLLAALAELRK